MTGYLTPNAPPSGTRGVVVFLPDEPFAVYYLLGALAELAKAENWQKHGTVEPETMASEWEQANHDTANENLNT